MGLVSGNSRSLHLGAVEAKKIGNTEYMPIYSHFTISPALPIYNSPPPCNLHSILSLPLPLIAQLRTHCLGFNWSAIPFVFSTQEIEMAKNVGILAMEIYFPPTCIQQVRYLSWFRTETLIQASRNIQTMPEECREFFVSFPFSGLILFLVWSCVFWVICFWVFGNFLWLLKFFGEAFYEVASLFPCLGCFDFGVLWSGPPGYNLKVFLLWTSASLFQSISLRLVVFIIFCKFKFQVFFFYKKNQHLRFTLTKFASLPPFRFLLFLIVGRKNRSCICLVIVCTVIFGVLKIAVFLNLKYVLSSSHRFMMCRVAGGVGGSWRGKQREVHNRAWPRLHGILFRGWRCYFHEVFNSYSQEKAGIEAK